MAFSLFRKKEELPPIEESPELPQLSMPSMSSQTQDLSLVLSKLELLNTKVDNLTQNLILRLQSIEQRLAAIEKLAEESQKTRRF